MSVGVKEKEGMSLAMKAEHVHKKQVTTQYNTHTKLALDGAKMVTIIQRFLKEGSEDQEEQMNTAEKLNECRVRTQMTTEANKRDTRNAKLTLQGCILAAGEKELWVL